MNQRERSSLLLFKLFIIIMLFISFIHQATTREKLSSISFPMINKTCLFLHGLESGPRGKKAEALKKIFEHVSTPDLRTGVLGFRSNTFMMSGLRNISSLFFGSYTADITTDVLRGGSEIALSSATESPPDIVVASSMGGAIALQSLRTGRLSAPTILLAPALGRLLTEESMDEWCEGFIAREGHGDHPIVVIHSVMDDVIDIEHSRKLCRRVGAELVEVADGDHSLNDYLLDGVSTAEDGGDGTPQGNNLSRVIDRVLNIRS